MKLYTPISGFGVKFREVSCSCELVVEFFQSRNVVVRGTWSSLVEMSDGRGRSRSVAVSRGRLPNQVHKVVGVHAGTNHHQSPFCDVIVLYVMVACNTIYEFLVHSGLMIKPVPTENNMSRLESRGLLICSAAM